MRVTVYVLAAIMLSAWAAESGQAASHSGVHGPRSLIDKKTAVAIGLAHPHAAKGAQARSDAKKKASGTEKTRSTDEGKAEGAHAGDHADPKSVRHEASVNGRSLTELGLKPPVDPRPGPALSLHQAELQRIQAETQRLGGLPYVKPAPLPPAQPLQFGPVRNGTPMGMAGNLQQHSPRTLTPLGGVAAGGNIGTLSGSSFLPRRR